MKTRRLTDHLSLLILDSRKEWLQQRTRRIGGSDAAAIVGLNPYKTNQELWEEKTGRREPTDISSKSYVQYGHDAEPLMRWMFSLDFPDYKVGYIEDNMFLNDRYPFAHASLDGWLEDPDGRMGVLEIKTTNILQSMAKEKWKDRIPDNYYCQVLWYLMVTGFDFAILKAQLKYDSADGLPYIVTKHFRIEREEVQQDIDYLEAAGRQFWEENIKKDIEPALILPEI